MAAAAQSHVDVQPSGLQGSQGRAATVSFRLHHCLQSYLPSSFWDDRCALVQEEFSFNSAHSVRLPHTQVMASALRTILGEFMTTANSLGILWEKRGENGG
jgi:hypothetical protein